MLLSKSMEKTFQRLKNKKARDAFVEAELVNGIANQIRVLRQQREWTQKDLAEKIGTTQGVVSRLEDPSYGRYSIKTLLNLASIFDVAFLTRFVPFSQAVAVTWDTQRQNLEADSFDREIDRIFFYSKNTTRYFSQHKINEDSTTVLRSFKSEQLEEYFSHSKFSETKDYSNVLSICRKAFDNTKHEIKGGISDKDR